MMLFNGYRPGLAKSVIDSLDLIIAETRTNEEWDAYWQLRRSYEEIYGIRIGTTNYNYSEDEYRVCHYLKSRNES